MSADLGNLLMVLLTLPAGVLILRRLGLNPAYAMLPVASLVIPLLGHTLLALYVATARWPSFTALPKPVKRVKL